MNGDYEHVRQNGRERFLHHVIWEEHYPNDPVLEGEVVHHIDGNPRNNCITNLQKITRAEHMELHQAGRRRSWREAMTSPEYRKKCSRREKSKWQNVERRRWHAEKIKALWADPEYRARQMAVRKKRRTALTEADEVV